MKVRLKKSVIGVAYFAALIFTANAFAQTNNEANVKLLLEVQNMRQEISILRNKVEKQGYLIRELQQASGVAIVEPSALNEAPAFEPIASPSQSSASNNTSLGEISSQNSSQQVPVNVQSSGQVDFPLQPGPIDGSSGSSTNNQTIASNQTSNSRQNRLLTEGDNAIKTSLGEMELYNKGIAKLRAQEYKSAASIFSAQLQNHPKGTKAGDGYFWLAETFYILNDLDSSAKSYESLFSLFPQHTRAPKALFKLTKVYLEKEDKVAAKSTVKKLVNLYSTSKEAAEAKSLYRDLL